ncbi:hypothetical protein [Candidatus Spongiihabitans sp.]
MKITPLNEADDAGKYFIAKPKNRVFTVKTDNFQRFKCFIANPEERP